MTSQSIPIVALVSPTERACVDAAGQHLARVLTEAAGAAWHTDITDSPAADPSGAILLTSFGPEVERDELWSDTEARLRARYELWSEAGVPVFICTVLRHIREADPAERLRRLVRIRRLNLLAATISQRTGALVIDLDRALADIGAARLGTDYRLEGALACDQAGKSIAMALLTNGLDHLASVDLQDSARAIMERYQPAVGLPAAIRPQQLMAIGRGRRKQMAAIEPATAELRHQFLIRQIMARRIGLGDAAFIFLRAVRHVGLRRSIPMLTSAVRKLVGFG